LIAACTAWRHNLGMKLVIRAHSLKNEPLSQAITGHFDEGGGTIGRSDSNTMTLPDPERHVSRLQAEVRFADGAFAIRNVGSANPIVVNGRPVAPGEGVAVAGGEELRIGGYAMHVALEGDAATARKPSNLARAPVAPRTVIAASAGEAKTDAPHGDADPFADFVDSPPPAPARHDEFDPFADLSAARGNTDDARLADFLDGAQSPPPRRDAQARGGALDDLLGLRQSSSGPGIDTLFGLEKKPLASADPLYAFLAPAKGEAAADTKDPLVAFGLRPAAAAQGAPAAFDHVPELAAAYMPPAVQAPPAAKAPPSPRVPAPRAGGAAGDALWQAFCDGAGLSSLPQGSSPEQMRIVGQLLRNAVEGTLKLVAVRAAAKQELRAQVTTIQAKNNNPLKFSADTTTALTQLLQPPLRGFMAGPDAMRDAMDDLLGHGIGTMAGMRAALQGMLARFEPARLESRLASHAVIDALVPMHRRAKLWELYVKHYARVHDEAQEDFHELFGRAFVKAYEEQLARLDAARRKRR
jgi:FHA domain-containing protein